MKKVFIQTIALIGLTLAGFGFIGTIISLVTFLLNGTVMNCIYFLFWLVIFVIGISLIERKKVKTELTNIVDKFNKN